MSPSASADSAAIHCLQSAPDPLGKTSQTVPVPLPVLWPPPGKFFREHRVPAQSHSRFGCGYRKKVNNWYNGIPAIFPPLASQIKTKSLSHNSTMRSTVTIYKESAPQNKSHSPCIRTACFPAVPSIFFFFRLSAPTYSAVMNQTLFLS